MPEKIIIIGGGGHAKVIIDCITCSGDTAVGILDDALPVGHTVLNVPVVGAVRDYAQFQENKFIIAIGNNAVRRRISEQLSVSWYTAIHPRAVISRFASVGEGSMILVNAVVNAGASVGRHCIVNTGAVVEHDNQIGDFVHLSPNAALGGAVSIGDETHIGIGATVKNNISICRGCTIGAGSVVVKNIGESGTYVGLPAYKK